MSEEPATHLLSPPWGLPGTGDDELRSLLEDGNYADAAVLLRDQLALTPRHPRWKVLLAHCRFRDALEVMEDDRLPASQEALRLLEEAAEEGLGLEAVLPFREGVEQVLAEETARELRTLAALPAEGALTQAPLEVLLEAAQLSWTSAPLRASELFEAAAEKLEASEGRTEPWRALKLRAALCLHAGGQAEKASGTLEAEIARSGTSSADKEEWLMGEAAAVALLEDSARGHDAPTFGRRWTEAERRGSAADRPFPSAWPHQERILRACLSLPETERALQVCRAIEAAPRRLPRALQELIAFVRTRAARSPS